MEENHQVEICGGDCIHLLRIQLWDCQASEENPTHPNIRIGEEKLKSTSNMSMINRD
jgi:hypothetical protein